ncbi:ribose-phosphate diphosphokinase [Candidatus Saccharibacteria bacterium]|nr:ribose-phosphate diphosphokinase [Candidatus Saccharibacteria bacterium]
MTNSMREFVLKGVREQAHNTTLRFTEEDVGRVVVSRFAQSEILVNIEDELNGRDVIIFFSYEPPINERITELRFAMQVAKRAGADRITVIAGYAPYSRGEKQDQYHSSIAFKDFADSLNLYNACFITCEIHSPIAMGFFDEPSRELSLRDILMAEVRMGSEVAVVVSTDVGGVKDVRKWSEALYIDKNRYLAKAVVDKMRTGNDDSSMAEQCFGADVNGKNVLVVDDEAMTLGTLVSAAKVLQKAGAKSIRAAAYHGVLVGSAIQRLLDSPIQELIVTNTVYVPQDKLDQAKGKLRAIPIERFLVEAARRWHVGESLRSMIEYAK